MNTNAVRWNLYNYYQNKEVIKHLKSDLEEYRKMDGMKAQVITGMPIAYSPTSKIEMVLTTEYTYRDDKCELMEYVKKLEEELDKLMRIDIIIDTVFRRLKEPARSIIEMRYFICSNPNDVRQRKYNWEEISEEVKYNQDYCKQIDAKVILEIQNKITHI